jgi:hypothetical protein
MSFKVNPNGGQLTATKPLVQLGKRDPMKMGGGDLNLPDTKEALNFIDKVAEGQSMEGEWACAACGVRTTVKNSICWPVRA